jgi:site-specific DNA-methyltransferase (adenine-specific)
MNLKIRERVDESCPFNLQQGDCLELMKSIPDSSIDMILTDPPYGIKYSSNMRTKTEKFDVLKNDDNDIRLLAYSEFARILKNNSVAVVFTSWKNVAVDIEELQKLMDIKNIIVWFKGGSGMGDLKHTLSTNYELAIVCHKGKCRIRGKREGSVFQFAKVNPNKMVHPTEKPVDLIEKIISKFTDENAVILDPFAGSGSTGVAAVNTGRKFIGFELDDKYFEIAKQRINDAVFSMERHMIEN